MNWLSGKSMLDIKSYYKRNTQSLRPQTLASIIMVVRMFSFFQLQVSEGPIEPHNNSIQILYNFSPNRFWNIWFLILHNFDLLSTPSIIVSKKWYWYSIIISVRAKLFLSTTSLKILLDILKYVLVHISTTAAKCIAW